MMDSEAKVQKNETTQLGTNREAYPGGYVAVFQEIIILILSRAGVCLW